MSKLENGHTKSLGEYIKFRREKKGLRLTDLAEKSEISIAYLSKLENCRRKKPSIPMLKKLADVLEVSVMDLLQIYLKIYDSETKDIRDVLLDGDYTIEGRKVPEEVRRLLSEILERIFSKEWQQENNSDILHENLIRKIKHLNDLL